MSERVGPQPLKRHITELGVIPLVATHETISHMHPEMRNLSLRLINSPYFVPMLGPYDPRLNHLGKSNTDNLPSDVFEQLAFLKLQDEYKNQPRITFLSPQDISQIYSATPALSQLSKPDVMWFTESIQGTTLTGLAEAKLSVNPFRRDGGPGTKILKQIRKAAGEIRGDKRKIQTAILQHMEEHYPHLSPRLIIPPRTDERIIVPVGSPIKFKEAIYLPTSNEEVTQLAQAMLYDLAA